MRFCKPMKRHFITAASGNASVALSMAKEAYIQAPIGVRSSEEIQSLVQIINGASLKLISACERYARLCEANLKPRSINE